MFERWTTSPREPAVLTPVRDAALAEFNRSGWPTRRNEAWRFTNLKSLVETDFQPTAASDQKPPHLLGFDQPVDRLVLINGRFSGAHSDFDIMPAGAYLGSFKAWAEQHEDQAKALLAPRAGADHTFETLTSGLFDNGFALILDEDVKLERPILVEHWGTAEAASASHLRSIIRLGKGAEAVVFESWGSTGAHWHNGALDIDLADGAKLGHYKLQRESETGFHTTGTRVKLAADARYDGFSLMLGASVARQDVRVTLEGPGAHCALNGAYLLAGRQEATMAVVMDHAAPNCTSDQVVKGCLTGRAHGVFQGRIEVRQVAQKTDANQLNKTVLLSDRAYMDTKPELEIYADDVKCSHGASVGDLDETALFYLRSRGIEADAARRMLIEAFVLDAVEKVEAPIAEAVLKAAIADWLAGPGRAMEAA